MLQVWALAMTAEPGAAAPSMVVGMMNNSMQLWDMAKYKVIQPV